MKKRINLLLLSLFTILLVACNSNNIVNNSSNQSSINSTSWEDLPLRGYDEEVSFAMTANDSSIIFKNIEDYIYYIESSNSIVRPGIYHDLYQECLNNYSEIQKSNNLVFKLITNGKYKKLEETKIYTLSLNNETYEKKELAVEIKLDNNNITFEVENNEKVDGFYIELGLVYVNNDTTGSLFNLATMILYK